MRWRRYAVVSTAGGTQCTDCKCVKPDPCGGGSQKYGSDCACPADSAGTESICRGSNCLTVNTTSGRAGWQPYTNKGFPKCEDCECLVVPVCGAGSTRFAGGQCACGNSTATPACTGSSCISWVEHGPGWETYGDGACTDCECVAPPACPAASHAVAPGMCVCDANHQCTGATCLVDNKFRTIRVGTDAPACTDCACSAFSACDGNSTSLGKGRCVCGVIGGVQSVCASQKSGGCFVFGPSKIPGWETIEGPDKCTDCTCETPLSCAGGAVGTAGGDRCQCPETSSATTKSVCKGSECLDFGEGGSGWQSVTEGGFAACMDCSCEEFVLCTPGSTSLSTGQCACGDTEGGATRCIGAACIRWKDAAYGEGWETKDCPTCKCVIPGSAEDVPVATRPRTAPTIDGPTPTRDPSNSNTKARTTPNPLVDEIQQLEDEVKSLQEQLKRANVGLEPAQRNETAVCAEANNTAACTSAKKTAKELGDAIANLKRSVGTANDKLDQKKEAVAGPNDGKARIPTEPARRVPTQTPEPTEAKDDTSKDKIIVIIAVVAAVAIIILVVVCAYMCCCRQSKNSSRGGTTVYNDLYNQAPDNRAPAPGNHVVQNNHKFDTKTGQPLAPTSTGRPHSYAEASVPLSSMTPAPSLHSLAFCHRARTLAPRENVRAFTFTPTLAYQNQVPSSIN